MATKGTRRRTPKKANAGTSESAGPAPVISDKFGQSSNAAPPAVPIELKVKWAHGSRSVYELALTQGMEIEKPGQPVAAKQDFSMTYRYAFTVASKSAEGGLEVDLEFLLAQLAGVVGGYTWQYDSSRESTGDATQVAELFDKILGAKIRYCFDVGDKGERIEGLKELLHRLNFTRGAILKPGSGWDDKQLDRVVKRLLAGNNADKLASLRRTFNTAFFRRLVRLGFYLPTAAVGAGNTWSVQEEYDTGSIGKIVQDYKVHFKCWEMHQNRMCARLEFQGTEKNKVSPDPKPSWAPIVSLESSSSGVSWFEPQLGSTLETEKNVALKIVQRYAMNPMEAQPQRQSITTQLQQVISTKLVSLE